MSPNSRAAKHARYTFRFLSAAAAVALLPVALGAERLPVRTATAADGHLTVTIARGQSLDLPSVGSLLDAERDLLVTFSKLAQVDFTGLAPVWQQWWFFTSMGVGVVLLAFGFHHVRVRHLVQIERMRSRIAADLHNSVAAHLSRIAALSEAVRRQAEPVLPQAIPALASIANDAREVIDEMSEAVWFADPKLDNLQQVIVRVRTVASDLFDARQIAWTLDAPANTSSIKLAPEQRRHVYLIFKETLANVLRHAGATRVAVRVSASRRRLIAEIVDDGIGSDPNATKSHEGSGRLTNLHAHASALGGIVTITARDEDGGTRFLVEAPIG